MLGQWPCGTRPACHLKLAGAQCNADAWLAFGARIRHLTHLCLPRGLQAQQEGWDREHLHTVGDYAPLCGKRENEDLLIFSVRGNTECVYPGLTEFLHEFFPQEK